MSLIEHEEPIKDNLTLSIEDMSNIISSIEFKDYLNDMDKYLTLEEDLSNTIYLLDNNKLNITSKSDVKLLLESLKLDNEEIVSLEDMKDYHIETLIATEDLKSTYEKVKKKIIELWLKFKSYVNKFLDWLLRRNKKAKKDDKKTKENVKNKKRVDESEDEVLVVDEDGTTNVEKRETARERFKKRKKRKEDLRKKHSENRKKKRETEDIKDKINNGDKVIYDPKLTKSKIMELKYSQTTEIILRKMIGLTDKEHVVDLNNIRNINVDLEIISDLEMYIKTKDIKYFKKHAGKHIPNGVYENFKFELNASTIYVDTHTDTTGVMYLDFNTGKLKFKEYKLPKDIKNKITIKTHTDNDFISISEKLLRMSLYNSEVTKEITKLKQDKDEVDENTMEFMKMLKFIEKGVFILSNLDKELRTDIDNSFINLGNYEYDDDIPKLISDEDNYEGNKWLIENAIKNKDFNRLNSMLKEDDILEHDDLIKKIKDALKNK